MSASMMVKELKSDLMISSRMDKELRFYLMSVSRMKNGSKRRSLKASSKC